jgi:hypothetical protein
MTTTTQITRSEAPERAPVGDQCVVMYAIGWKGYFEWVTRPDEESETAWIKALRNWVAGPLAERYRSAATPPQEEGSDR